MLGVDQGRVNGGYAVVALRGELDVIDAADVADDRRLSRRASRGSSWTYRGWSSLTRAA